MEEIRDFIRLYLENKDDGEVDKMSKEVYDYTIGDPIMVKFAVLGKGLEQDVEEMYDRYLKPQQEMKTMLICSLLDISNIAITDRMIELCGVRESALHLNGSILHRSAEGLWRTKHPRWDRGLFSFLYGNNTRITMSNRRKQDLKDSLYAIFDLREETVTYSAIMTLVVDPTKDTVHKVIVDARNGQVLYTSEGKQMGLMGESMFGLFGDGQRRGPEGFGPFGYGFGPFGYGFGPFGYGFGPFGHGFTTSIKGLQTVIVLSLTQL
jgi:hypothetical protein